MLEKSAFQKILAKQMGYHKSSEHLSKKYKGETLRCFAQIHSYHAYVLVAFYTSHLNNSFKKHLQKINSLKINILVGTFRKGAELLNWLLFFKTIETDEILKKIIFCTRK